MNRNLILLTGLALTSRVANSSDNRKQQAPDPPDAPQNFERRDQLRAFEGEAQTIWEANKAFDSDPNEGQEKFMVTFPYPYMNGALHVGHAFTISKAEIAAGFQRMKGKNVLFPFGFHCTGSPIAAAASKIENEMAKYGNPPTFPNDPFETVAEKLKGKLAAKQGKAKFQWQILDEYNIAESDKPQFADPDTWLNYFPPVAIGDLKRLGVKVDWRRSFITTDKNPYYDRFIQWQFRKLKEQEYIEFGKRPAVFSPETKEILGDHDRAEGEGVGPQEQTLIKMELVHGATPYTIQHGDKLAPIYLAGRRVFLVAATLRPETMYGQTNCFVYPEGDYIAIEMKNGDVFVLNEHAKRNLAWQDDASAPGVHTEYETLATLQGWDLLGRKVKAPLAIQYPVAHVLPLLTIKMDKGTGIVTSVPSDAPDDYAALQDIKRDEKFRKKYFITSEMVDVDVVPIIDIPGYGEAAAQTLCIQHEVKNQKDEKNLKMIKDIVYKNGFYKGTFTVGPYAGQKVCDAKGAIRNELIEQDLAMKYWEPESLVTSRTGDIAVVALQEQWYIKYGDEEWRGPILQHLQETMNCFNPQAKEKFVHALGEWMTARACSRSHGLGTKLPWDQQYVIESLSDSTIYMAYYTIAHFLQDTDSLDGTGSSFPLEDLTDAVFDYVFTDAPKPTGTSIPGDTLDAMKKSFEYWYPMDMRVSGHDLIPNHLTMALYNHAAIWPDQPDKWPQSYFAGGFAKINGKKMSKSTGNFMTLADAVEQFSADATRFALADAGDSMEDANFAADTAKSAIMRLTAESDFIEEFQHEKEAFRAGEFNWEDRIFANEINKAIEAAHDGYETMHFRFAVRAFIELQNARGAYRKAMQTKGCEMHRDVLERFVEVEILLINPICPHWAEIMWQKLGKEGMVVNARWPEAGEVNVDLTLQAKYIEDNAKDIRKSSAKHKTTNSVRLFVTDAYQLWQVDTLRALQTMYDACEDKENFAYKKHLMQTPPLAGKYAGKEKANVFQFAAHIVKEMEDRGEAALSLTPPFDEYALVEEVMYLLKPEGIDTIAVFKTTDPEATQMLKPQQITTAKPGKIIPVFYHEAPTLADRLAEGESNDEK